MKIIKTYEEFAPSPNLLLPPHKENLEEEDKNIFFLKTLYELANYDIEKTAKRINDFCELGYYIKIKHLKSKIELIKNNEPCVITGIKSGEISKHGVDIKGDSIIIEIEHDKSLFVLSIEDDYQITFKKPKIVISEHDPYGEEDWEYE